MTQENKDKLKALTSMDYKEIEKVYTEIEKLKESKEYKALDALSDACNDFGFKAERFAKGISLQHRTLQQKLCSMAVAIIKEMGSEGYMYDGRNEASVKFCKELVESGMLDKAYFGGILKI